MVRKRIEDFRAGTSRSCSRRFLAHFTNSLRWGDHVWLLRHLHCRDQASGMRARDPVSCPWHRGPIAIQQLLQCRVQHLIIWWYQPDEGASEALLRGLVR